MAVEGYASEALLLHGEAGPMTSAFQPEQPARHRSQNPNPSGLTRRRLKEDNAMERVIVPVSGQTAFKRSFPESPYACAQTKSSTDICATLAHHPESSASIK